jgi:hypothetical protein
MAMPATAIPRASTVAMRRPSLPAAPAATPDGEFPAGASDDGKVDPSSPTPLGPAVSGAPSLADVPTPPGAEAPGAEGVVVDPDPPEPEVPGELLVPAVGWAVAVGAEELAVAVGPGVCPGVGAGVLVGWGVGGGVAMVRSNATLRAMSAVTPNVQTGFRAVHSPPVLLQPAKCEPAAGAAVTVMTVPLGKSNRHTVPQLMPAGELVTVPKPVPPEKISTNFGFRGRNVQVTVVFAENWAAKVQDVWARSRPGQVHGVVARFVSRQVLPDGRLEV